MIGGPSPGAKYILPDGNEALPLPEPGRTARCITRVDYRAMSEEPLTKQTAVRMIGTRLYESRLIWVRLSACELVFLLLRD